MLADTSRTPFALLRCSVTAVLQAAESANQCCNAVLPYLFLNHWKYTLPLGGKDRLS